MWEARWPNGYYAGLRIGRSRFKPWPGHCVVFLGKTLYSPLVPLSSEFTAGGNPAMDQHPIQGGVEILLVVSCYGNRDKLRSDGPLGS